MCKHPARARQKLACFALACWTDQMCNEGFFVVLGRLVLQAVTAQSLVVAVVVLAVVVAEETSRPQILWCCNSS